VSPPTPDFPLLPATPAFPSSSRKNHSAYRISVCQRSFPAPLRRRMCLPQPGRFCRHSFPGSVRQRNCHPRQGIPRVRPLFCLRVPCRISYIPSSSVFYVSFYSISNVRRDRIAFPALSSVTQFSHGFLRDRQTENPHQGTPEHPPYLHKAEFCTPGKKFPNL